MKSNYAKDPDDTMRISRRDFEFSLKAAREEGFDEAVEALRIFECPGKDDCQCITNHKEAGIWLREQKEEILK